MTEVDLTALTTGIKRAPRVEGMRPVTTGAPTGGMDARTARAREISGRPLANDPRIPPPEPDGYTPVVDAEGILAAIEPEVNGAVVAPPPPGGVARLVVSYGRKEGECVVGIERPPEWDVELSKVVPIQSVRDLLPILSKLAKLKDLTGGELDS